ncbi:MAG: TonB-dependent receptor [Sphingomonadaceae bacterium]|nr:TonB-dependent receptor [Sphingomonadaceae bacterium]
MTDRITQFQACRALMTTTALGFALALPQAAFAQQAGTSPTAGPQSGPGAAPTSAVSAQSPSAAPATARSVPTGGNEDIIVTARRSAESQQRVPIAITTVTAQGLRDQSVRDIIEIQRVTPGLFISSQGQGARARLTIRGQYEADNRLTTDSSVGVYVDGVNWTRNYGLRSSLIDIAQIEVLRGPQGTLFGRNTTGGAINITTQHPTYELGGYVDLLYGSYDNRQALAALNVPLVADRLALRVAGQIIRRDGFSQDRTGAPSGDDHTDSARALLRADPIDTVHILLSADYVRQRNHGSNVIITNDSMLANANTASGALGEIAAELGLNRNLAADRLTAYNAWRVYYDAFRNGAFFTNYGRPFAPYPFADNITHYGFSGDVLVNIGQVNVRSITAYRRLIKYFVMELDGTPFYTLTGSPVTTHQRNFSQELQVSSIDGRGLDWQFGAYYNRETGNEFINNNNNAFVNVNRATVTDADVRNTSKAIYAQAVYNFAPNFRMTLGGRYSWDTRYLNSHNRLDPTLAAPPLLAFTPGRCNLLNPTLGGPVYPNCSYALSTSSHRPTWLVSADWRPVPEIMLYTSVSRGYRAGGFTATGSSAVQPSVAALQAAYTPFQPETVTNYEAGFKSDLLGRRLRVNFSAYYQDYTNIQRQVRDVVNGLFVTLIRNAASATIYGGELEIVARPTNELTLNANAAYTHARYDRYQTLDGAGNPIDLTAQPFAAPKWTYNLGATYQIPLPDGSVRLNANWAWTGTVNFAPGTPGVALTAYDPSSLTQRGHGLLDARITWSIASWGLDISLFGKNLANSRYWNAATNAQGNGWNIAFPGDPRMLGVELRKTF